MGEIKASIVIPTYNKKERLELVLTSFNYQRTDNYLFEVLILDDGSADGTGEMVGNFKSSFPLKYIYHKNSGRSFTRNTGIMEGAGELIIFCDDDLIVPKEYVLSHIREHAALGEQGVVHGQIYNLPYLKFFKNPATGETYPELQTDSFSLDFIKKHLLSKEDMITMDKVHAQKKITAFEKMIHMTFIKEIKELQWLSFTGGNVSCPRSLLIEAGLFDESFGKEWGCEDLELGYRLFLLDKKFVYSKEACNFHLAHFRSTFREEVLESNRKFYSKHNDPWVKYLYMLMLEKIKDLDEYIAYISSDKDKNVS
ncbi:MAG TPA: glycosyltransferase [Mobilitalea sp.]|nr:glycosyltransferase [Mobilitalea sp.]